MNSRKAKQLREIAKVAPGHVPNGYTQLKELYKALPGLARGRASKVMKRIANNKPIEKPMAAMFCLNLLKSALGYRDKSEKVKERPHYIRLKTGKKYK